MSETAEKLKTELLSLSVADRIAIADLLYASVPGETEGSFVAELDRRRAEHENGADPGIPTDEFFRKRREKRQ